jgi:hypothetical protein
MKRTVQLMILALTVLMGSVAAKADPLVFQALLLGVNEVPPNASPGTGTATVTLDGNFMRVQVTFSGLVAGTQASHIHCCAGPGVNAMVATTTPTFPNFPLGVTAGTYDQTFDMTLASSYNPAFITAHGGTVAQAQADLFAAILAGQTYLNIHSTTFPGGEIRGQLRLVPEPTSISLLLLGLGGGIAAIRRRRK